MKKLVLIALPILLFACGCQSYQDGLAAICNAPSTCGEPCASVAPDARMAMMAKHIEGVLSNGEAVALFESLAAMAPEQKVITLKQEAQQAGLADCRLADVFATTK